MTSKDDLLNAYAQGWVQGNPAAILQACTPDYQFVDNGTRIARSEFDAYLTRLKNDLAVTSDPFMEISKVVTHDLGDVKVACCYWTVLGTEISGTGLILVENGGVSFEEVSY